MTKKRKTKPKLDQTAKEWTTIHALRVPDAQWKEWEQAAAIDQPGRERANVSDFIRETVQRRADDLLKNAPARKKKTSS